MTQRTSPVRGIDLSRPVTAMKEGTALRLDDFVCRSDGVRVRPGYTVAASGVGDAVVSLLSYPGQLFAATDDGLYADGALAVGSLLSGDWSSALIANPGGTHLVAVNGADVARRYDGVTWGEAEITGVNSRSLTCLTEHANRLWAVEKNSLTVWHLATDAVEGAAQPLHLEGQCKLGGKAVAVAGFGEGDPRLAIVTDKGELVIYTITNPALKDGIALKGVLRVPAPVGKRCFTRLGSGRLGLLTVKGLLSVPDIVAPRESARAADPNLSFPVSPGIAAPQRRHRLRPGSVRRRPRRPRAPHGDDAQRHPEARGAPRQGRLHLGHGCPGHTESWRASGDAAARAAAESEAEKLFGASWQDRIKDILDEGRRLDAAALEAA